MKIKENGKTLIEVKENGTPELRIPLVPENDMAHYFVTWFSMFGGATNEDTEQGKLYGKMYDLVYPTDDDYGATIPEHRRYGIEQRKIELDEIDYKKWKSQQFGIRKKVFERDRWTCVYCGGRASQIDHKLARSLGGINSENNMVACCLPCNQQKGNRYTYDEFMALKQK